MVKVSYVQITKFGIYLNCIVVSFDIKEVILDCLPSVDLQLSH